MMTIQRNIRISSVLCFCFLIIASTTAQEGILSGLQSGDDIGPSYSGGMAYDAENHVMYITGATYGDFNKHTELANPLEKSSCYLGIVKMPTAAGSHLEWIQRQKFGTAEAHEACSALALKENKAYVAGDSEEKGLLTGLRKKGTNRATNYGIVMEVAVSSNGQATLQGGALIHDEKVQYPKAVVASPVDQFIYLVSVYTENTDQSSEFQNDNSKYPNFTSGGIKEFGSGFQLMVEQMRVHPGESDDPDNFSETVIPTWRKPFGLNDEKESVHASGIALLPGSDALIVVGFTRGSGVAFGSGSDDGDMDGYILKLDPTNGGNFWDQDGEASEYTTRIQSPLNRNDLVTNVCTQPDASDYFYIVGASAGGMGTSGAGVANPEPAKPDAVWPFLMKIESKTLNPVWTTQIQVENESNGPPQAYALACDVRDNFVYFGGIVEQDSFLVNGDESQQTAGKDDMFVAKLSEDNGDIVWLHQIGTTGNDRMAHGGGLIVDRNGHVIVFGDTTGEMFRSRQNDNGEPDQSNVFLMSITTDGEYQLPSEISDFSNTGDANEARPIDQPTGTEEEIANQDNGSGNNDDPTTPENPDDFVDEIPQPPTERAMAPSTDDENSSSNGRSGRRRFANFLLFMFAVGLVAFFFINRRQIRQKELITERAHIFAYLQAFDVEDVDLRHSATGGWHGTYVNRLAHGVNKADPKSAAQADDLVLSEEELEPNHRPGRYSYEMSPLTHSSIVKDSLFLDVDSKPRLGEDLDDSRRSTSSRRSRGSDDGGLTQPFRDSSNSSSSSSFRPRSLEERRSSLEKPWGKEIV